MDFTGHDINIDMIQNQMLPHTGKTLAQAFSRKEDIAATLHRLAFFIQD